MPFLLAIMFFILGCGTDHDKDYNVFRYNQINHITSLDPAFSKSQNNIWATHHIFDGLVKLDDSLNVVPSIAKSWSISDNGLVYTFNLRDDVPFHGSECIEEGRVVNSEDVVYSLRRLVDPDVNSPGSWLFSDKIATPNSFYAVDDTTFEMKLESPFLPMLGILTMQYCSVVPRECVESKGKDFAINPVGTGPFQFKRWIENQALFLTRFDDYFGGINHNLD